MQNNTVEKGGALAARQGDEPVRVMIVDDSAVIRGMLSRWLESDPGITIVNTSGNGVIALNAQAKCNPEVVVLDIEMPEMDGLTALPKLLEADRDVKVIMASTLTLRNAGISMQALAKGASDYIPKPTSTRDMAAADTFKHELIEKVKTLGSVRRQSGAVRARKPDIRPVSSSGSGAAKPKVLYRDAKVELRKPSMLVPSVLAIGSSTGGPQALLALFETIKNKVKLPIFLTQHMPPTFTTILAEHIANASGMPCAEGEDGEVVESGRIYVAPGDYHMTLRRDGANVVVSLNQDPPVNFCRPAVDPMLESLQAVYGSQVLAVILTGMGQDGLVGGRGIADNGGTVIAQDEETSVVWGMPGAVATGGVCSAVLPLDRLGPEILKLTGARP